MTGIPHFKVVLWICSVSGRSGDGVRASTRPKSIPWDNPLYILSEVHDTSTPECGLVVFGRSRALEVHFRACMSSVVDQTLTYAKMYRGYNQKVLSTRVSHITLIGTTSENVQIRFGSLDQGGPKHLSLLVRY